jgi:hypothetical protein
MQDRCKDIVNVLSDKELFELLELAPSGATIAEAVVYRDEVYMSACVLLHAH